MIFERHNQLPDISELAEMADMMDSINFESQLKRDALVNEVKEHGIPDLTGLLWFFYLVMKGYLIDDFENSANFESEYLKKHMEGNIYDERLDFHMSDTVPDFGDLRDDLFLERLLQDYKNGNGEAKEYIRALLIRYEPDMFKRLKKYRSMDLRVAVGDGFLPSLGWEDRRDGYEMLSSVALLIVMCQILNIEVDAEMYALTGIMKNCYDRMKAEHQNTPEHKFDFEKHKLIFDEVQHFSFDDVFDARTSENNDKLISYILSEDYDYSKDSYIGDFSDRDLYCDLIRLVKAGIDVDSLSKSELYSLMQICHIMDDLLIEFDVAKETVYSLVYEGYDPFPNEKAHLRLAVKPGINTIPMTKKVIDAEKVSLTDTDYIREIERLQAKVNCAESDVVRQRELYEAQKAENLILREEVRNVEDLKKELIALREFAYKSAEGIETDSKISREDMIKALSAKSICVIGGHDNWVNKLKLLFPKWKFAAPQEQGSVPVNILDNVDHVFIFTNHICHPQYNRFMDFIRKHNVKITYVSKVNIEDNIKEFYSAIFSDDSGR